MRELREEREGWQSHQGLNQSAAADTIAVMEPLCSSAHQASTYPETEFDSQETAMLTIYGKPDTNSRFCDGLNRRNFLKQSLLLSLATSLAACVAESGTTNELPASADAAKPAATPQALEVAEG